MSGLWSPQQQQWLKALGHTMYVHGTAPEPQVPSQATPAQPEPAPAPPARRRPGPSMDSAPVRRGATRLPDKLHIALIRASGCNPGAADAAQVIAQWPPSTELRGNPAAKRALWPQLRALRRPAPR